MEGLMTTGEELKLLYGLQDLENVRICRIINSVFTIYCIYFNTRYRNLLITTSDIMNSPTKIKNIRNNDNYKLRLSIPIDLDSFNKPLNNATIILVDLAGVYGIKNYVEDINKKENNLYIYYKNRALNLYILKEKLIKEAEGKGFSLIDLKQNALSNITKKSYGVRKKGRGGSFLKNVNYNKRLNTLTLTFYCKPTFKNKIQILDLNNNVKNSNHYTINIKFDRVTNYLGDINEFLSLSYKEQRFRLNLLFKEAYVRVHSNDFSYYYQGGWENADLLNFAIYPFKGVKGEGIWSERHMGEYPAIYVTKHIFEVINTIPFLTDEIIKGIKEQYK